MPTVVGILTVISIINTSSERLKARNLFIYRYFSFYELLKFHAQLSWAWKKFYNLGARTVNRALSKILKTGVIEPSLPKSGSQTLQKNVDSFKNKHRSPSTKNVGSELQINQQLVRALQSWSESTPFDTPILVLNFFYEKVYFEKNQLMTTKAWIITQHAKSSMVVYQWCSQNAENVTHIKGRLLGQAVILFNCVPFLNGNFS